MTEPSSPTSGGQRIVLRVALSTRLVAAIVLIPLGLLLILGGLLADHRPDGWSIVIGAICLVGALRILTIRALCTRHEVVYGTLVRRRIPAAEIRAVRVTMSGYFGRFPTIVLERESGRSVELTSVQTTRTVRGRGRAATDARRMAALLGVDAKG